MIPEYQNQKRLIGGNKGIKKGFHQYFRPNTQELGWRDYFIKNNTTLDGVCQLNSTCNQQFKNIMTREYLNNLENVDNIYKSVNY